MYVQLYKPHQYYVHPISIIISIHLLLLINIPFQHANDDYGKYYSDCDKSTTFKCGDTTLRLKYPFWVENIGPSYCGLEGFKISCERNEIPVIDIGSDNKYRVLKIDPIASAIILKRYDDHLEDGTCAPILKTMFEYGPSVEDLYMFYGCPLELHVPIGIRNNITCKSGDMDEQVIFGVQTLLQDYLVTLNKSCKILLRVPVNRTDFERFSMNETLLEELLDSSFVVHYYIINKTAC